MHGELLLELFDFLLVLFDEQMRVHLDIDCTKFSRVTCPSIFSSHTNTHTNIHVCVTHTYVATHITLYHMIYDTYNPIPYIGHI